MLLLYEGDNKKEEGIKSFFADVHELLLKTQMNPFYKLNSYISSKAFDSRVKQLAAKFL